MEQHLFKETVTGKSYHVIEKNDILTNHYFKENTIYELNHVQNLEGKRITFPKGCVLKFQGGLLQNGSLDGLDTEIEAGLHQIFEKCNYAGTFKVIYTSPEWFGDLIKTPRAEDPDNVLILNEAKKFAYHTVGRTLLLSQIYEIKSPLIFGLNDVRINIEGISKRDSGLRFIRKKDEKGSKGNACLIFDQGTYCNYSMEFMTIRNFTLEMPSFENNPDVPPNIHGIHFKRCTPTVGVHISDIKILNFTGYAIKSNSYLQEGSIRRVNAYRCGGLFSSNPEGEAHLKPTDPNFCTEIRPGNGNIFTFQDLSLDSRINPVSPQLPIFDLINMGYVKVDNLVIQGDATALNKYERSTVIRTGNNGVLDMSPISSAIDFSGLWIELITSTLLVNVEMAHRGKVKIEDYHFTNGSEIEINAERTDLRLLGSSTTMMHLELVDSIVIKKGLNSKFINVSIDTDAYGYSLDTDRIVKKVESGEIQDFKVRTSLNGATSYPTYNFEMEKSNSIDLVLDDAYAVPTLGITHIAWATSDIVRTLKSERVSIGNISYDMRKLHLKLNKVGESLELAPEFRTISGVKYKGSVTVMAIFRIRATVSNPISETADDTSLFLLHSGEQISHTYKKFTASSTNLDWSEWIQYSYTIITDTYDFGNENMFTNTIKIGQNVEVEFSKFIIYLGKANAGMDYVNKENVLISHNKQQRYTKSVLKYINMEFGDPITVEGSLYIPHNGVLKQYDGANYNAARHGRSTERPLPENIFIGFTYFQTDNNKMVIWNGSHWVNIDGTVVK